MTIIEEITELLANFFGYLGSFADIGDFFANLWNGIAGWFTAFFAQIGGLFG